MEYQRGKSLTLLVLTQPFVEAANYTCIDAPADVSEWAVSGLTQVQGKVVKPALVGESAFSMECEMCKSLKTVAR